MNGYQITFFVALPHQTCYQPRSLPHLICCR